MIRRSVERRSKIKYREPKLSNSGLIQNSLYFPKIRIADNSLERLLSKSKKEGIMDDHLNLVKKIVSSAYKQIFFLNVFAR